jgi:hypothetical protein
MIGAKTLASKLVCLDREANRTWRKFLAGMRRFNSQSRRLRCTPSYLTGMTNAVPQRVSQPSGPTSE